MSVHLGPREMQCLVLISEGCTNMEIGERIHLSSHTVKTYVNRLRKKLNAKDRAHAVAIGFRSGLLRIESDTSDAPL